MIIQAQYDEIQGIAQKFSAAADEIERLDQRLQGRVSVLHSGGWEGNAAAAFFAEMDQSFLPALHRLKQALQDACSTTLHIADLFREAEAAAADLFRSDGPSTTVVRFEASSGLPEWLVDILDGAVIGDFSDDTSLIKLISQFAVGLIPGFGQVADVRDIVANLRNIENGREGAWLGLGLAILAIIPGFDGFKGAKALKPIFDVLGEKGATEFAEFLLRNPDQAERVAKNFAYLLDHRELIELLSKNPDAAIHMIRRWEPEWIDMVADLHRRDIKFDPAQLQAMTRDSSGRVVFLETGQEGSRGAGLAHILENHAAHFESQGIVVQDIPALLMEAVKGGEIVGRSGFDRPIYRVTYNGTEHYVAITVGNNGYIVGAHPVRKP